MNRLQKSITASKRRQLCIGDKIAIIAKCTTQHKTHSQVAEGYGVNRSTIMKILKQKESILAEIEAGNFNERNRLRTLKYRDIDEAVLLWSKK